MGYCLLPRKNTIYSLDAIIRCTQPYSLAISGVLATNSLTARYRTMPDPVVDQYPYRSLAATWDHSIILPHLLDKVRSLPSHASIFDSGCGNGALLAEIARHGSWHLAGMETSPSGAEIARSRGYDVRCVDPNAPIAPLFGAARFDLVISVEVIEHLHAPRLFLRQATSLLKPGGTILLTTPYHGYLKNLLIAISGKFDHHVNPLWDGGHVKFWSRNTLTTLLAEAGFENIQFQGAGRIPYLWKSMVLTAQRPF